MKRGEFIEESKEIITLLRMPPKCRANKRKRSEAGVNREESREAGAEREESQDMAFRE